MHETEMFPAIGRLSNKRVQTIIKLGEYSGNKTFP